MVKRSKRPRHGRLAALRNGLLAARIMTSGPVTVGELARRIKMTRRSTWRLLGALAAVGCPIERGWLGRSRTHRLRKGATCRWLTGEKAR
ncbi:MAG: HTH domain-containing protein [Deltaproteobacteria bacterium]|nr:HTH domain-containing protein [Deltaproteobacteria bacterium]